MSTKSFLSAGDVLINPSLLAYAAVETDTEGPALRLGFSGQAGLPQCEVRLAGLEARSVLRWLRSNAEFLDAGSNVVTATRRPVLTASHTMSRNGVPELVSDVN